MAQLFGVWLQAIEQYLRGGSTVRTCGYFQNGNSRAVGLYGQC
jgi:hypothetical protein